MKLTHLLSQKKPAIYERWLNLIFAGYPPETAGFLKKEKDRFSNPMAYRISQGAKGLCEALVTEMEPEEVSTYLDEIIRIKAVQDFTASQALAFVFLLKTVIRDELAKEIRANAQLAEEVLELESRIDGMALLGFDVYQKRREKLNEIRVNEIKSKVSGLLRRSGISVNNL